MNTNKLLDRFLNTNFIEHSFRQRELVPSMGVWNRTLCREGTAGCLLKDQPFIWLVPSLNTMGKNNI